jgi:hypothetical protein
MKIFSLHKKLWLSCLAAAQIIFHCILKNIFNEHELTENSVVEVFSVTANDGKNYKTKFYNLDAIIAVGYRVNSKQATQYYN